MRRLYKGGEVLANNEWNDPPHVPPLRYHGDKQREYDRGDLNERFRPRNQHAGSLAASSSLWLAYRSLLFSAMELSLARP